MRKRRTDVHNKEVPPPKSTDWPDCPRLQVIIFSLGRVPRVGLCVQGKNKQTKPPPAANQGPS